MMRFVGFKILEVYLKFVWAGFGPIEFYQIISLVRVLFITVCS